MTRLSNVCVLILFVFVLSPLAVLAQDPLDLDLSFGLTGRVATNFGSDEFGSAVALQSDGKIVVAGYGYSSNSNLDFLVARYHSSGTLDSSFGGNGRVTTDLGYADSAFAVAIQSDGKIVLAGGTDSQSQLGANIAVVRYMPNGTLDSSFGVGGIVKTNIEIFDYAFGVTLQSDSKILVVGQTGSGDDSDIVVARYNTNGGLDGTFGSNGIVRTNYWGFWDIGRDIDVLADGRIVVGGSSWLDGFTNVYGIVARYMPDGSLDTSLNGGFSCGFLTTCGIVGANLGGGSYDWISSIAVKRADGSDYGKIVASGQFGVARFNSNGALDVTFSGDGINESGPNQGNAVAIRNDGRIVRAGTNGTNFGVELYGFNGQITNGCSSNWSVTADLNGGEDLAHAVAIQADGKIVVAGAGEVYDANDFAMVRFNGGCNIALAASRKYFVAYHKFVHPQDKVGPSWPGAVPNGLVRSTQVVVPATESASISPLAFKSYSFGDVAARSQSFGFAFPSSLTAAVGIRRMFTTAIGEFSVGVGRQDYAMLPATVRALDGKLNYPRNDQTRGYGCSVAESSSSGRFGIEDPLNPGRKISLGQVTHLCSASDPTERTPSEPEHLLCFAALGTDTRNRIFVRDTLGSQLADIAGPAAVCVDAVESEGPRKR